MANPSVRNGHIDIANELAEQFAKLNLKGEDWRILWVVLRQTWGWKQGDRKKDFDYISLSQFEQKTGMKRPNVARVLKRLVAHKLLLKRENGYGINQNYEQWLVAHRLLPLPSSSQATTLVAQELPKVVAHKLPTIDKKDNYTKETTVVASKDADDELERAIAKHLRTLDIRSPHAYLLKIKKATAYNFPAIRKAWQEWKAGGIRGVGEFYSRCLHHAGIKAPD